MIARVAVALFFYALAIPWIFEGTGYLTGAFPTISRIAYNQLTWAGLPTELAVAFLCGLLACPILLLLILHFAGVLTWWRP